MSLVSSLVDGAAITVETSLSPPVTINLKSATEGEPSLLMKLLRPKVRLTSGNVVLAAVEPAGDPGQLRNFLFVVGLALLGLFLLLRLR